MAQQSELGAKLVMYAISSDRTLVIYDPDNEKAHGEVNNYEDDGTSEGYSTLGFDMNEAEIKKGTASELKRIFGKSMANRLVSRVVLNKFIKEVA